MEEYFRHEHNAANEARAGVIEIRPVSGFSSHLKFVSSAVQNISSRWLASAHLVLDLSLRFVASSRQEDLQLLNRGIVRFWNRKAFVKAGQYIVAVPMDEGVQTKYSTRLSYFSFAVSVSECSSLELEQRIQIGQGTDKRETPE
jgi:hypothetical protein